MWPCGKEPTALTCIDCAGAVILGTELAAKSLETADECGQSMLLNHALPPAISKPCSVPKISASACITKSKGKKAADDDTIVKRCNDLLISRGLTGPDSGSCVSACILNTKESSSNCD